MPVNEAQQNEIKQLRAESFHTSRSTVPALENLLYEAFPVLDQGFIRVVDYMGDDAAVVQAARVSYGRGTKKVSEDRGLIRYLMRHRHTTPFEMCEIKFHIKLPVFVARQWIRHRTASVNEYSARYSILNREFYIPAPEQLSTQSQDNRQGRGNILQGDEAVRVLEILREDSARNYADYQEMLNEDDEGNVIDTKRDGLARELARMNLPLNIYTEWYWKCDLHNLLHFLSLRADPHAQHEIRVYADAMMETLRAWVPITAEAFEDYRIGGVQLSRAGLEAVKQMIAGDEVSAKKCGIAPREWRELMASLGREE